MASLLSSDDVESLRRSLAAEATRAKVLPLKLFNEVDTDRIGRVSADQMVEVLRSKGIHFEESTIPSIVAAFDADKDGCVTRSEWLKIFTVACSSTSPQPPSLRRCKLIPGTFCDPAEDLMNGKGGDHSLCSVADEYTLHVIYLEPLHQGMTHGNLIRWLAKRGDQLSPGTALCEVDALNAFEEMSQRMILSNGLKRSCPEGLRVTPSDLPPVLAQDISRSLAKREPIALQVTVKEPCVLAELLAQSGETLDIHSPLALIVNSVEEYETYNALHNGVQNSTFGQDARQALYDRRSRQRQFMKGEPDSTGAPCHQPALFHHFGDVARVPERRSKATR